MCNCKQAGNLVHIKELALKYKAMNNNCLVAIYRVNNGYNFCEYSQAQNLNLNIVVVL